MGEAEPLPCALTLDHFGQVDAELDPNLRRGLVCWRLPPGITPHTVRDLYMEIRCMLPGVYRGMFRIIHGPGDATMTLTESSRKCQIAVDARIKLRKLYPSI